MEGGTQTGTNIQRITPVAPLEGKLEHNNPNDSVTAKLAELPSLEHELSFWLL